MDAKRARCALSALVALLVVDAVASGMDPTAGKLNRLPHTQLNPAYYFLCHVFDHSLKLLRCYLLTKQQKNE